MIPPAAIASGKKSDAGFRRGWKPALLFPCPPQNQNRTRYQNEAARQQQPAGRLTISEILALNNRVIWNFVFRQQGECGFIYRCDVSGITPASWNGNLHFFRSVIVLNDSGPGVFVLYDDSSSFGHGNGLAVVVMHCETNKQKAYGDQPQRRTCGQRPFFSSLGSRRGGFLLIEFLRFRPAQEQDKAGHHDEDGWEHYISAQATVEKVLVFNQGLISDAFLGECQKQGVIERRLLVNAVILREGDV